MKDVNMKDVKVLQGERLNKFTHRTYKFITVKYQGYYGYIDHHGSISTTPGMMPNHTDERAFQTEQAAINDAKFCIDLTLKLFKEDGQL